MEWILITEFARLNSDHRVYVAQPASEEDRRLGERRLSRETLRELGLPVGREVPLSIVELNSDSDVHEGEPLPDLYFAMFHGPEGSNGPVTVFQCGKHQPL